MANDVLKPEKSGNSRAAQTRIKGKSAGGIGGQRAHDLPRKNQRRVIWMTATAGVTPRDPVLRQV